MPLYECDTCRRCLLGFDLRICGCGGKLVPLGVENIGLIARVMIEIPILIEEWDTGRYSFRAMSKRHGMDRATVKKVLRLTHRI